jgi:hypothetical protein
MLSEMKNCGGMHKRNIGSENQTVEMDWTYTERRIPLP